MRISGKNATIHDINSKFRILYTPWVEYASFSLFLDVRLKMRAILKIFRTIFGGTRFRD